jgi:bifunctional UDP-N-acetylglucosamine pyrophosphorylase/glucosamine-1-phosphate N-acetyltransferase
MKAVILCAGKGKRLMPITKDKPKCMVNILKRPIIDWNINYLSSCGINDIIIIYGYKGEVLKEHLKDNLHITWVYQENLNGTAGAIELIKKHIKNDESFLVLAGDTIYNTSHIMRLKEYKNSLLYTRHYKNLQEFGTIEFDKFGNIKRIHEKESKPISSKVNISAYHFTPSLFDFIEMTPLYRNTKERTITDTINIMIENNLKFTGIEIRDWNHLTYPHDIDRISDNFFRGVIYDNET